MSMSIYFMMCNMIKRGRLDWAAVKEAFGAKLVEMIGSGTPGNVSLWRQPGSDAPALQARRDAFCELEKTGMI